MAQNAIEKILASHSSRESVKPGEILDNVSIDLLMGHDGTATLVLGQLEDLLGKGATIWDTERVLLTTCHFSPPATSERADIQNSLIRFSRQYGIDPHIFDGICHQLILESEKTGTGQVIIGADSHTVTAGALGSFATGVGATDFLWAIIKGKVWLKVPGVYRIDFVGDMPPYIMGKDLALELLRQFGDDGALYRAFEYHDNTRNKISMDSRASICNMSVEGGAKAGLFIPDEITLDFIRRKGSAYQQPITPDEDASYERSVTVDVSVQEPLISVPHKPGNVKYVKDVEGTKITQAFLGSCTAGRLEDLKLIAEIFKGKKLSVKVIVIPSSRKVYEEAMSLGYLRDISEAGAAICNPSCGPCAQIDKGLLGDGEVCVSTANRNYRGRMGSQNAEVYLASTLTVALSAVEGKIVNPRDYYGK